MRFLLLGLTLLCANGWAHESQSSYVGESPTDLGPIDNTNELSGMLVIGRDIEWLEKGNKPPDATSALSKPPEAINGDRLYALAFLTNPGVDADGVTNIVCDMAVLRPDGSRAVDQTDISCLRVPLDEDPTHLYQVSGGLGFIAEPTDLRGEWRVEIVLHDLTRGTRSPLFGSFIVK